MTLKMIEVLGGFCFGILAGWMILYVMGLVAAWGWVEVWLIRKAMDWVRDYCLYYLKCGDKLGGNNDVQID